MTGRLAVYALTPQGARLARGLAGEFGADLYLPRKLAGPDEKAFDSLPAQVAEVFHSYQGHLFVAACGIVVRAVAPLLKGKSQDPAVVALDQAGRHAVSLLSGHLGGANDLARRAAAVSGGEAVITTATDTAGLPSLDLLARDSNLAIENLGAVKNVNAGLLEGRIVQVFDPEARLVIPQAHCGLFEWVGAPHLLEADRPCVAVSWREGSFPAACLKLRPRVVVAGTGCRKGTPASEIVEAVREACARRGVAVKSLAALASIEAKRGEPGLREAADVLGLDLIFFPASRLGEVAVPNPSANALKHMGVESVCEAAALLATGADTLLLPKMKTKTVTVALAAAS
ncbi:cobalt-precorrin 5A hydrolase [Fundidesulfovibrio terrae]|uniref:cobalt-precorrin 5A hydrolase n=1 Tax=Fundidesulfovibrio terrae TaxID=2922866 RepID=UPI001FAEA339|nr:cobalt-precorrin 5A hydrolase [Fundidesulfovibrio terrae]